MIKYLVLERSLKKKGMRATKLKKHEESKRERSSLLYSLFRTRQVAQAFPLAILNKNEVEGSRARTLMPRGRIATKRHKWHK
jgi:hypothetical protein